MGIKVPVPIQMNAYRSVLDSSGPVTESLAPPEK